MDVHVDRRVFLNMIMILRFARDFNTSKMKKQGNTAFYGDRNMNYHIALQQKHFRVTWTNFKQILHNATTWEKKLRTAISVYTNHYLVYFCCVYNVTSHPDGGLQPIIRKRNDADRTRILNQYAKLQQQNGIYNVAAPKEYEGEDCEW